MALPPYFAATTLRSISAATGEAERRVRETMGMVHLDVAVGEGDSASVAAITCIDLAARTFGSIRIIAPDDREKQRLRAHARAVNPRIEEDAPPRARRISVGLGAPQDADVRFWASGWWAGQERTDDTGTVSFGGMLAGIAAFNEAFKAALGDLLEPLHPRPAAVGWSLLDLTARTANESDQTPLDTLQYESAALIGCGAIGHAASFGLGSLTGVDRPLDLVDPQTISFTNLQRYMGALVVDAEKARHKARLLYQALTDNGAFPRARSHITDFAGYRRTGSDPEILISALDSAEDRRMLQAALPRLIVNGWTRVTECGAGIHDFQSDAQCLACTYLPRSAKAATSDMPQLVAELGLPVLRVIQLLAGSALQNEDLRLVERHRRLQRGSLQGWRGESLRPLFGQLCGMAEIRRDLREHYVVPLPQASALAGLLVSVQFVKVVTGLAWTTRPIEVSLVQGPGDSWQYPVARKVDHPAPCICKDPIYLQAHRARWPRAERPEPSLSPDE